MEVIFILQNFGRGPNFIYLSKVAEILSADSITYLFCCLRVYIYLTNPGVLYSYRKLNCSQSVIFVIHFHPRRLKKFRFFIAFIYFFFFLTVIFFFLFLKILFPGLNCFHPPGESKNVLPWECGTSPVSLCQNTWENPILSSNSLHPVPGV